MHLSRFFGCAVGIGWACASTPALAETALGASDEAVSLTYSVPAECPDQSQFEHELRQRGIDGPLHFQTTSQAVWRASDIRHFYVHIANIPETAHDDAARTNGFRGSLTVTEFAHDTPGSKPKRSAALTHADGKTCADVVAALALMTAVAIRPASLFDTSAPRAPQVPTSVEQAIASPSTSAPTRAYGHPQNLPIHVDITLLATAHFGIAQLPITTFGSELALARRDQSLRFGVDQSVPVRVGESYASARFGWITAHIDACPFAARIEHLTITPCPFVTLGWVQATRSAGRVPANDTRLWSEAGGRVRASTSVGRLRLGADISTAVVLTRDRFFLRPDVTVYRPGAVDVALTLAAGLELK